MKIVAALVVLICVAAACADRNVPQRGYISAGNQPYWFLGGPRQRSNTIQAIQVPVSAADFAEDDEDDDDQEDALNDNDDDEDSFDDEMNDDSDDDDDDDQDFGFNRNQIIGVIPFNGGSNAEKNYLRSILSKTGGNAGTIMVPDGFIELEGQGIVDEETGETSLYLPREALAGIPDGSVVALVEDSEIQGKANKVIVTRRRRGPKKGRRRGGNRRRRRRGGKRRRRGNNVRVIRKRPIRRGGNRRRRVNNVIRM